MTKMKDKNCTCRDCNRDFVFSIKEQEAFAEKGYSSVPGRCPECQAVHKAPPRGESRPAPVEYSGGRSGGGQRELFAATCGRCGKETQVPFRPSSDRPVYCSDCYSAQRASSSNAGRPSAGGFRNRR